MKKTNWKIFINLGTVSEFKKVNALVFPTKNEAKEWAKKNGYPQKCVMSERMWNLMNEE